MSFLSPWAFLFAAAIPVVVVFYLLKRKRVIRLVSSTVLWQRFLAETQASSPFQKLRHNWLLLIQILLLLLVVLALARPYFSGQAGESRLRVLILDGSASMQSTDVAPNRFAQAQAQALSWVDGLRAGEQIMVLLAGAVAEVKQSPTSDKAALRRAIGACQPSDAPARLSDAIKTAAAFTFENQGEETVVSGEIHLFSDGAAGDLTELANRNLPLVYHRIGRGGHNAGIVSLEVRPHPDDPAQRAIFASIVNASTNVIEGEVEVLFDAERMESRPLVLAPTNTLPLVFLAPQERDGIFTVRLRAEDDLEVDNVARVVSLLPTPIRVLLLTEGNQLLEKALRAASANLELTVTRFLADDAARFDVAVIDDVTPIVWPNINTLAIHTASTNWFESWTTVTGPPIVDWKSTHPLLRFVNFDNVLVAESLSVRAPAWGIPLVESPGTPLIVAGEVDKRRLIWIAFDPLQSNWPLRVSYPIFIVNAVEWLDPANVSALQLSVQAGQPFRLNLYQPVGEARLTLPDGQIRELALPADAREIVVGETMRQGVYRLQAGTNATQFCVNLLDASESATAPRDALPIGEYETVEATAMIQANLELWRWIAAAGLAVLMFEWWYYHKRTV